MKKVIIILLVILPILSHAQDSDYEVKSYMELGTKAPNTHHIGEAWLNFLVEADDDFKYNITQATFSANSTLDWHKHSSDQVLIIVKGEGYYQEKGKEVIVLKKGDVIKCDKDIEHWHSSTADSEVSYIAIYGSTPTTWTDKLTRQYYDGIEKK